MSTATNPAQGAGLEIGKDTLLRLYRQMGGGKPAQLPSPSMQTPPKPARRHGRREPG